MNEELQAVVDSVNDILKDTNPAALTEKVVCRLVSFGYIPTDEDVWMIAFAITKVQNHVLNQINHTTVPEGLMEVVVDMICGDVLNAKFLSGKLDLDSLDLSGVVSVHQGDTTVAFDAAGSDEAKMKGMIAWLMQGKGCDFLCYRKLRW